MENHLRSRRAGARTGSTRPSWSCSPMSAPLAGRFAVSAGRVTGTAEFKVAASSSSSAFQPATIGRDHGANDMGAPRFLSSSSRVPVPSSSIHHPSAKQRRLQASNTRTCRSCSRSGGCSCSTPPRESSPSPPLPILWIEENRAFDQMYMEDILPDKRQVQDPLRVKITVMAGFHVQDRVLKCRVLTTSGSVP